MNPGHLAPKNRHFTVGAGVHYSAYALDGLTHSLGGGPALSAFEGQMLDKMGNPGQLRGLITRACADAQGNRNRPGVGHGGRENSKLVIQDGALVHVHLIRLMPGRNPRTG